MAASLLRNEVRAWQAPGTYGGYPGAHLAAYAAFMQRLCSAYAALMQGSAIHVMPRPGDGVGRLLRFLTDDLKDRHIVLSKSLRAAG